MWSDLFSTGQTGLNLTTLLPTLKKKKVPESIFKSACLPIILNKLEKTEMTLKR